MKDRNKDAEYGTETLSRAVKVVADFAEKVEKGYADDNKLSFFEGIQLARPGMKLVELFSERKQITLEFKDLDKDEADELCALFAAEFDLKNDKVEEAVEKVFCVLKDFNALRELFK